MIDIHIFPCLSDNYGLLVRDRASGATATIDTPDADAILAAASARGWTVTEIWNTHWHPDHAGGNARIKEATGAVAIGPEEVRARLGAPLDRVVRAGETVRLGETPATVIDVGGHTLGHIAYHFAQDRTVFVGDALFALGCGRLFEGDAAQAWASLSRLMALPDDTIVYCAHEYTEANARFCATIETGNSALTARIADIAKVRAAGGFTVPTSIGLERATNPFVRADLQEVRAAVGLQDAPAHVVFGEVRRRKDEFR